MKSKILIGIDGLKFSTRPSFLWPISRLTLHILLLLIIYVAEHIQREGLKFNELRVTINITFGTCTELHSSARYWEILHCIRTALHVTLTVLHGTARHGTTMHGRARLIHVSSRDFGRVKNGLWRLWVKLGKNEELIQYTEIYFTSPIKTSTSKKLLV